MKKQEGLTGVQAYAPTSKGTSFDVSTPKSMAFEIKSALQSIQRKYGNIDKMVQERLFYTDVSTLYQHLSAEQIDTVAMGIDQIEARNGLIIGHQTGMGKGRVAAAMIRYAVLNNIPVAFVTEKSTLFSDIYRDLLDIGSGDLVPFIYNNDEGAHIKDAEGNIVHKAILSSARVNRMLDEQIEKAEEGIDKQLQLPEGYDFIVLTYSQIANDNIARGKQHSARRLKKSMKMKSGQGKSDFLRRYTKDHGILVTDESHNAGGADSITGFYFKEILGNSKGAAYLSATYAKRADNMPVYSVKTSIKETGLSDTQIQEVFEQGDLPMQEIAASELSKAKQMVRFERAFKGIEVNWITLEKEKDEHWRTMNKVLEIVRDIGNFQARYVAKNIAAIDEFHFGDVEERKGTKDLGVNNADYFSKTHNLIFQLMFSLKARQVAEYALEQLEKNEKVVIAFSSTMGSFLSRLGYENGDEVSRMDFSEVLRTGLDSVMQYSIKKSATNIDHGTLKPEDLDPAGQAEYARLVQEMEETSTGISMSPIDVLINIIESRKRPNGVEGQGEYYRVRECTGRNAQVRFEDGIPTYRRFKSDKGEFFRQFNSGEADVLLINQSASTGVSAHASEKFKDQRIRHMIIHQPELDINREVQKRGRINRTGQVVLPKYSYVVSTIPSEQRQFMVLKGKMRSLDANTTGSQNQSKSQLDVKDFMNKYGGQVIFTYLVETPANDNLNDILNDPCYRISKDWDGNETKVKIPIDALPKRVTNRVNVIPVESQEKFYKEVMKHYDDYVANLKRKGTYDLETEYFPYEAELEKRWLYVQGKDGKSDFAKAAVLDRLKCKRIKKPFTLPRIDEMIDKVLRKRTAEEYAAELIADVRENYPEKSQRILDNRATKTERLKLEIAELESQLVALPQEGKDEKETAKFLRSIERMENRIASRRSALEEYEQKTRSVQRSIRLDEDNLVDNINFFKLGRPLYINIEKEGGIVIEALGIVTHFIIIKSGDGNPYAPSAVRVKIAVNTDDQELDVPLSWNFIDKWRNQNRRNTEYNENQIRERWDKQSNLKGYETHFIAGENVFNAFARAISINKSGRAKLVKYNTSNGEFVTGVRIGKSEKLIAKNRELLRNGVFDDQHLKAVNDMKDHFYPRMAADSVKDVVLNLPIQQPLNLLEGRMIIERQYDGEFKLMLTQKGTKPIYTDPKILAFIPPSEERKALGYKIGEFSSDVTQRLLEAYFDASVFPSVLDILSRQHGLQINSNEPIELDISAQDTFSDSSIEYAYELATSYQAGKYPATGFKRHDASGAGEYGTLVYTRPLNAKQRFQYDLVPVFNNISEPYNAWKQALSPADEQGLQDRIQLVRILPKENAEQNLGQFIFDTAHEEGETRYVFGTFDAKAFGKLLYRERIGVSATQDPLLLDIAMMEQVLEDKIIING